jgi:cytochrome c oxidase subunit 1
VSALAAPRAAPPPAGPLEAIASTDHKRIATRTLALAFAFFLAGGVLALLMRLELAGPGLQLVSTETYNELFTIHGSTMIYLVITPAALGLGLYFVPLHVGAPDIAAPRVALLALWLFALGGLTIWSGFLTVQGAAKATWVGFDPLARSTYTPESGQDLWIAGVFMTTGGQILTAGCLFATLMRKRAPGMTLLRMPVFCWGVLVACLMVLFAFPALLAALALLWAERQWGIDVLGGGVAYQHLFWFYGHPVVYVMFFPFVGAVAEVISTFSDRRFFGYFMMVLSLLLFTALSTTVWAHHMFTTGAVANRYFSLTTTAILIPAGVEYFDLVGTMWGGRIRLTTPMLFAIGFLLLFLIGGLTGIWVASAPLDYHVNNSYFVVAHFHYTLFGGSAFGAFAALYYWWPKMTGWRLREGLGRVHFVLMFIGTALTFTPQFILGHEGMTRRIADYPRSSGWEGLNMLSTVGAFLVGVSILALLMNITVSWLRPRHAGDDPWQGNTLEWATSSPPPRHNFDRRLPPISSYAPLWDLRHGVPPDGAEEGPEAKLAGLADDPEDRV